jgi:hypothetical protein
VLREYKIMATVSRCAPELLRAHNSTPSRRMAILLAVAAAIALTASARTARAAFDDGAGACCGDWSICDSGGDYADSNLDFTLISGGCFVGDHDAGPISLTGGAPASNACDGLSISADDNNDNGNLGADCGNGGGADAGGSFTYDTGGQISGDSVKLPEPGSFALLGLFAAGLLARRNARKTA